MDRINPLRKIKRKGTFVCFSGGHLISYLTETNITICEVEALACELNSNQDASSQDKAEEGHK